MCMDRGGRRIWPALTGGRPEYRATAQDPKDARTIEGQPANSGKAHETTFRSNVSFVLDISPDRSSLRCLVSRRLAGCAPLSGRIRDSDECGFGGLASDRAGP